MKNEKILIIDDNEDDRLIMERFLRKVGYKNIFFADTAEKGVILAEKETPAIALVDIKLPDLDGIRTCSILKTKAKVRAVIMVTGLDDQGTKKLAVSFGSDGYMVKPVTVKELSLQIQRIIGKNSGS